MKSKVATNAAPGAQPGKPAPGKPAPNVEAGEELKLKRVWFGIVTKRCDRSEQGFVKAIRVAMDDLSGVQWNSPAAMCDGLAERIRKELNGPRDSIDVEWVGGRKSANATRFVITTVWNLREDVENTMSFALFAPQK